MRNIHGGIRREGQWMGVMVLMVLTWGMPSYADDAIAWVNSIIPSGVAGTNDKQCSGLDERWQLLREQISKKHEACLAEQAEAAKNNRIKYGRSIPKLAEDGDRCTYEACEGWHSVMSGRKARELRELQTRQMKACRENVKRHQQYIQQNPAVVEKAREDARAQIKEWQESPREDASALERNAEEGFKQAGKWSGLVGCGAVAGSELANLAGGEGCMEVGEHAGATSGAIVGEALELNRQIRNLCRNRDNAAACEKALMDASVKKRLETEDLHRLRRK